MKFEIDFLDSYTSESIIGELQRVAKLLGRQTVMAKDLDRYGRVKYHMVVNHFGSLRKGLEAAGLRSTRFSKASDEELLAVVADLWKKTLQDSGRRPRADELTKYGCKAGPALVIKRFGTWKNALKAVANGAYADAQEVEREPRRRKRIPVQKRFLVLKRDRYRCRLCNQSGVELEVDHVVPLNQGGTDMLDNLQTLCRDCNRGKSDRLQ